VLVNPVLAETYAEILTSELTEEEQFFELVCCLSAADAADHYGSLAEAERRIWCIHALRAGVGDGGLGSYLQAVTERQAKDTVDFLADMGATACSTLLGRALEVADSEGDAVDRFDALLDLSDDFADLEEWYDDACSSCIDALSALR
jgi:hypothetical protein